MKLNKIFIGGLAALALTACDDYLDVEPSTTVADVETVFSTESGISTALNGVYAKIETDETFGNKLYTTFLLNSDVDFAANANETAQGTQPRRFDVRSDASDVEKLWNNLYSGVETANEFIYNLQNSSLYTEGTTTEAVETDNGFVTETVPLVTNITQMMGEAKVMRAMFYHELLWYYGDIPFTLQATYETDNVLPAITKRKDVSDALIKDLQHAAEYMKSDQDATLGAPEHISKEAAYAMIARLALQAGGYSLNHDEGNATAYKMTRPDNYREYYQIARDYSKKIIDAGGHKLAKSYAQVFIDECNFIATSGDDPIFEIPFAQGANSSWGYQQGPASSVDTGVDTDYANSDWGETKGNSQTSYFYRFQFDENDLRRDYICGMWGYGAQGQPNMRLISNSIYSIYNNKWSKLWSSTKFGKSTTSATGINFAYIRYADVLLMFAEAENELNGPTAEAQEALKTVRRRAFESADHADKVDDYVAAANTKEDFLKLVLDERKLEFAGENMRWKDLVRNNKYAETLLYTFLTYYTVAEDMGGNANYMDMVEQHDGIEYSQLYTINYVFTYVENYNGTSVNDICGTYFPNNSLYMIYVVNPYGEPATKPSDAPQAYFDNNGLNLKAISLRDITGLTSSSNSITWNMTNDNSNSPDWWNDGIPRGQVLYSLFGYIRGDEQTGDFKIVSNGAVVPFNVNKDNPQETVSRLPAVRYLLPYPEEAIARSSGAYKNYYGF